MTDDVTEEPKFRLFLTLVLGGVVIGGTLDLLADIAARRSPAHLVMEVVLILLSAGATAFLARGWVGALASLSATQRDLAIGQGERDAWRARARTALEGLAVEVDRQFEVWRLTGAERELALRLIKGHSLKRIAEETDRSERTVRQHAVAVYRKSGLGGRAELAGFFLEDLLLTTGVPSPPTGTGV